MKTGSLYLGFHTSKKCGLVRRVSAAAHEAHDFQMVGIGQLFLLREQRVRYRLLSCKYPLFCKKKCSGLTMR